MAVKYLVLWQSVRPSGTAPWRLEISLPLTPLPFVLPLRSATWVSSLIPACPFSPMSSQSPSPMSITFRTFPRTVPYLPILLKRPLHVFFLYILYSITYPISYWSLAPLHNPRFNLGCMSSSQLLDQASRDQTFSVAALFPLEFLPVCKAPNLDSFISRMKIQLFLRWLFLINL